MLFVLYGATSVTNKLTLKPKFMQTLYDIVDTLSPSLPPLPYDKAMVVEKKRQIALEQKDYKMLRYLKMKSVHRTYTDKQCIQARANTLLFTQSQYRWIASRDFLMDITMSNRHMQSQGIIPRTKFIDIECQELAFKFCISVYCKVTSALPGSDKEREIFKAISDPLVILYRMMAAVDLDVSDDDAEAVQDEAGGSARFQGLGGRDGTGYSRAEEWKCRVAQYFAYCVDDGLLTGYTPPLLTRKGVGKNRKSSAGAKNQKNKSEKDESKDEAAADDDENPEKAAASVKLNIPLCVNMLAEHGDVMKYEDTSSLDEVLDFLLYVKRKPVRQSVAESSKKGGNQEAEEGKYGYPFEPHRNVFERFSPAEPKGYDILNSWTCNENVLCRLIESGYFVTGPYRYPNCKPCTARLYRSILTTKVIAVIQ
jgi:hypothetical protein